MQVCVLTSIDEIEALDWDSICTDAVFCHAWFKALEQADCLDIKPRHLIFKNSANKIIAIIPCIIQRDDLTFSLSQRLFGPFHFLFKPLAWPALLAYSPLASRSAIFATPGADTSEILNLAQKTMEHICKEEKIPVSGWPFVADSQDELHQHINSAKYQTSYLCPVVTWQNLHKDFESFLKQINQTHRRRYKMIRHELNQCERSGIKITEEPIDALSAETLAQLHANHHTRLQKGKKSPLTVTYFENLQKLGPQARLHVARKNNSILSYSIVIKGSASWHMSLNGETDYASAHAHKLHFYLNYYFPMQIAPVERPPVLHYGTSAYALKIERGCSLETLSMGLQFHHPFTRFMMRLWLPALTKWYQFKYRKVRPHETNTQQSIRGPLWQRIWNQIYENHRFVLISWSTHQAFPHSQTPPGIQVAPMDPEDYLLMPKTVTRTCWNLIQRAKHLGAHCYTAKHHQKLIGYMWLQAAGTITGNYLGPATQLNADEGFIVYSYVHPKYRGLGLARMIKDYARKQMALEGIRVCYSGISYQNSNSLRSNARLGAFPLSLWHYLRIGPFIFKNEEDLHIEHPLIKFFVAERQRKNLVPHTPTPLGDKYLWQRNLLASKKVQAWTPADPLWKQILIALKTQGLWWLMRKATENLSQRLYQSVKTLELKVPLSDLAPIEVPRIKATPKISRLQANKAHRLRAICSSSMYRQFQRFYDQGFHCYIAEIEEQIIAYNWYTDKPYTSKDIGTVFNIGPKEIFLVYSYTARSWRGKGIDPVLKAVAMRHYQSNGILNLYTAVDETNRPALKTMLRWQASPIRIYHCTYFLGFKHIISEEVTDNTSSLLPLIGKISRPHVDLIVS